MGLSNQGLSPGRTTLLGAINVLLETIGEQPIDSNEKEQIQDARVAESCILELHREGQIRGWTWNREEDYPFSQDLSTGEVVVPATALSFTVNPYRWNGRFVVRGQRVYDKQERTYDIDPALCPIYADVVWQLSWDDSPEAFNRWTTMRAARVFAARALGNDSVVRFSGYDEQQALAELMRVEYDQAQPNSLTGGLHPIPTYRAGHGLVRGVAGGIPIG
jgi:hypothetical protein